MLKVVIFLTVILLLRIFLFSGATNIETTSTYTSEPEIPFITPAKERISQVFHKSLPPDASALLLGIVFGEKGDFSDRYLEAIERTGVLHVIAASGMNVSMVAGFVLPLLILFVRRKWALFFATLAIIIYAALANFEESIVRASIMAIAAYGAAALGRQNTAIFALFLAAFVMIMLDPMIIGSVGFQLSVAATAGIVLFEPIFKKLKKSNKIPKAASFILDDFSTSTSAQLATIPILFFVFGTYSPISIISNLLILWTIPPIMILGGIASILGLFSQILATPILWLALPLLEYFKAVIIFLDDFAVQIEVEEVSIALVVGYYLILLSVIIWIYKNLKIRL